MSYAKMYQDKLTTAEKAVQVVKTGDWVDYGFCVGHPVLLDKALAARKDSLNHINVRGGVALWQPEITKIPLQENPFIWNSWHVGGPDRKLLENGLAYYIPIRFSEMPRYYRENIKKVDVAMIQVTPMDKHGYFNFGPNACFIAAMCECAQVIIVEVNKNMPRCHGGYEHCIHISDVHMIVEGENPPIAELKPQTQFTAEDTAVAKLVVEEIPNGACLQLGIGGMPNAIGQMIVQSDLKDLGVHSEMYVEAFYNLSMSGKVTGSKKNIDRYRQVLTFGAGSRALYDFLDDNPHVISTPVDYVNDARVIAQLDNFMSINNAVEVDLYGQISSESSGIRHISGAGGQLDFVLGAYLSKGGKSFICCTAAVKEKDGTLKSRIVPTLEASSVVTDTRTNTHWVVTEFGKVNLKGLSTWQRAEAIISVAHPNFRDDLIKQADKMRIWRRTNKK